MAQPYVVAVSTSPVHGFSKQPQESIRLLAGLGVKGDAHCGSTIQHVYLKRRDAGAPNHMQVHLLPTELLTELNAAGFAIAPGNLGENILTCGLDLVRLPLGTRLQLGREAVLELTCLRQPCAQIDRFQSGLQRRMFADEAGKRRPRVGVMAVVTHGGEVGPGDPIVVHLPPSPHRALTT